MTRAIVPTHALGDRVPEHGRIRLGVKTGSAMKSIDTFRFTSPDEAAIKQLAERYGGDARPWSDARANPKDQFEVITRSAELRVFLPPDAVSTFYELWTGGGCARRCDGEVCEIPGQDGMDSVPCICAQPKPGKPDGVFECKPYTRLNVVLPDVNFGGLWRLETKGWNAAHEMPGMAAMIERLHGVGLAEARLILAKEQQTQGGKKKHYVVPRLMIPETPMAMLAGGASVAIGAGNQKALPAATPPEAEDLERTAPLDVRLPGQPSPPEDADWFASDDDIADAEIIETPVSPPTRPEADPPTEEETAAVLAKAFPGSEVVPEVHFWQDNGFLCFDKGQGPSTTEPDKITCSGCKAEWEHRQATKGQPAARAAGAAKKRASNPTLAKLVIVTEQLAEALQAAGTIAPQGDEKLTDEVRHAVAWYVSKKETESTRELSAEAQSAAIDLVGKLMERMAQAEKLMVAYRERPL